MRIAALPKFKIFGKVFLKMYSIIDIESNGAGYRKESIIEIAIFRYDGHKITDQLISLVNPEAEITPFVQKLTGITPKMVKTAPKFHELAKRVIEITEDTVLVGHNIDFDYRMLRQSFKRLGYDFKINTIDTLPLAQKLLPEVESYSLGKLVKSLGIPLTDQHRAGGDARATLDLFKLLMTKDNDHEIILQHYHETNAKTYVNKVKELTQDLPNEEGIFYFQDDKGKILYSDFAQDINKSAKKIFNSKSKKWEKIQQEVEQIQYEIAGNHLVARLLMNTKGIHQIEKLSYGLYERKGKLVVEKNTTQKQMRPLLKFRSYTQGSKALNYINSVEAFSDLKVLKSKISLSKRNEISNRSRKNVGRKNISRFRKRKVDWFRVL